MPAPLKKGYRGEKARGPAAVASVRERLDALKALRGQGRVKPDKGAAARPIPNAKAMAAKARRVAKGKPAKD